MDILKIRERAKKEKEAREAQARVAAETSNKAQEAERSSHESESSESIGSSFSDEAIIDYDRKEQTRLPKQERVAREGEVDRAKANEVRPERPVPTPSSQEVRLIEEQPYRAEKRESDDPLKAFLARYDVDTSVEFIDPSASRSFDKKRFLSFSLGDEHYAISIMDVREIMRVVTLTPVPRAPKDILGILSKRGVVMPVIDLGATLGLREILENYNPLQRILTVGEGDRKCGVRVDELHEVIELDLSNIEEIPASFGTRTSHFLQGLGRLNGQMYILLDTLEVLRSLAQAAGLESTEAR